MADPWVPLALCDEVVLPLLEAVPGLAAVSTVRQAAARRVEEGEKEAEKLDQAVVWTLGKML